MTTLAPLIFNGSSLLADLRRRLIGELIVYRWSGFHPAGRQPSSSKISNIFSSETAWPIKFKFYVEPPRVGGMNICLRHLGHIRPIYGKIPSKIFFSRTGWQISKKLGMYDRRLLPIIVCSNDDPGMTMTHFTVRSNLVT